MNTKRVFLSILPKPYFAYGTFKEVTDVNLKSTDVNPILVRSQREPEGSLSDG